MSSRVPEGWEAASLNELCKFSGGSAFKEKYQGKTSGDYPFIKVSDMNLDGNQRFITKANNWIDQDVKTEAKVNLFPVSAVVFAKVGAALLLNRRRILTRQTAIDNNMMAAIPNNDDNNFLYYLLQDVDLGEIVQGGAVPSVNQSQMEDIPALIPPLPEQQKIATILSSVDDVIEKTRAQIDKLKDLKTGMMQELLTKGIGHTEFKDSPVGLIPAGWEVKCLPEIATYQNGKAFPSSDYLSSDKDGCYLVKPVNLDPDGRVNWNYKSTTKLSRTYWKSAENYRVGPHEILMNLTAQSLDDDFLGRVCITREGDKCILNQRIARIAANEDEVLQKYLFWALKGNFFRSHVERITQGSKVQHLYNSNLDEALIAFPTSILEQKKICALLNSLESAIYGKSQKLAKLKSTKKALMQDLLTGKVRANITDKESAVV